MSKTTIVSSSAAPVFLVGSVRSGTTLLRLMLSEHPSISRVHEFEYAVSQAGDAGWPDLPQYYDFLKRDRVFSAAPLSIDRSLSYPDLVRSFHEQRHADEQGKVWADVIHSRFHRCPELWPNARYIHLVRDPRDVARSCVAMGWHGNAYCGASIWVEAERRWDHICRRVDAPLRLELRYEDLLEDPPGHLDRICRFLALDYDPRMLSYSEGSSYDAPDPSLREQWRKKMSRREVQLVEHACGDLLERRGYTTSGYGAHSAGPMEDALLKLDSRARRLRRNVDRYGLGLVLRRAASRLGPESFRQRTQQDINAIDTQRLK